MSRPSQWSKRGEEEESCMDADRVFSGLQKDQSLGFLKVENTVWGALSLSM